MTLNLSQFESWFADRVRSHSFDIQHIAFDRLEKWGFDDRFGNLRHESGKFFSIEGIHVETNSQSLTNWNQPIINQPEVGFLGFIVKRVEGKLHFLMQAKMEPGNIRFIQLAPTLQATRSNYTRVHKGAAPPFLEYFRDRRKAKVLVDSLQSEQGGRFLRKRNRNIIIEIPENEILPESEDFIWLALEQIQELLLRDNVINMDARTVLSCLPPELAGYVEAERDEGAPMHSLRDILSWFTELKCKYDLSVRTIPLGEADPWVIEPDRIFHPSGNFFE